MIEDNAVTCESKNGWLLLLMPQQNEHFVRILFLFCILNNIMRNAQIVVNGIFHFQSIIERMAYGIVFVRFQRCTNFRFMPQLWVLIRHLNPFHILKTVYSVCNRIIIPGSMCIRIISFMVKMICKNVNLNVNIPRCNEWRAENTKSVLFLFTIFASFNLSRCHCGCCICNVICQPWS